MTPENENNNILIGQNNESEIFVDRVKLLFQQYYIGFFSALAVATVVVFVIHESVSGKLLGIWYVVILLLLILRLWLVYSSLLFESTDYHFWRQRYHAFLVSAFLLGASWGLLGTVLFPDDNRTHQVFIIVILAGMSSGALPLMFQVKNVFLAFVTPILLPFSINMIVREEAAYIAISLLTLFYFTGMVLIARRGENSVIEAIKLRFENIDLINRLEHTKNNLLLSKQELEIRVSDRTRALQDRNNDLNLEIQKRKAIESKLNEQKEIAEVTLKSIADGIITTDASACINYMNPLAEILTGYTFDKVKGQECAKVIQLVDEDGTEKIDNPILKAIRQKKAITNLAQCMLLNRDGSTLAIKESIAPIFDSTKNVIGTVIVLHDVHKERLYRLQLSHQAKHDALTGLYNRFAFEEALASLLVENKNIATHHAVIYIDLDEFKVVNDTCGHTAGDELLKQLSIIVPQTVRQQDMFARLGGDEFGVILEDTSLDDAVTTANLLLSQIREFRFVWKKKTFNIGASIGLFIFTTEGQTIADILSAADIACFTAKDMGRNRIHVYSKEDKELVDRRNEMDWVGQIRDTIANDRLVIYQQTIVPSDSYLKAEARHIEILFRVLDETDQPVAPGAFIAAAERYHIMPLVDRWVISKVLEYYKRGLIFADKQPCLIAINLSGLSLTDNTLLEFIEDEVRQSSINPEYLCFEITETAAISNMSTAIKFMKRMRKLGCQFAIDDFGSGVSSLAYLKNLPVEYVKIDGSFVRDMANDPVDYAMVESIHKLVALNGKISIAEYVESEDIIKLLCDIGVDYLQGHAIEKPCPIILTKTISRVD